MSKILIFIIPWFMTLSFASTLDVRVNPQEPIAGEVFKVIFEITTDSSGGIDPIINFSPLSVEVLGRIESGVRTKTTYINGKLSTERTVVIEYEMLASHTGSAFLRDIRVELGEEKLTHPTLRVNIVRERQRPREVFVKAELDRDEYFTNQSIVLRYYLYSRAQLSGTEIRKFPELNNFMKRYHQEQINPQRVRVGSEIYTKRIVYTAQLFAQNPGEYVIDPIMLNVEYHQGGNLLGSIGFGGLGQVKRQAISSEEIRLSIKQLPLENVPSSFTGLVGRHDFQLNVPKTKFITNEPIEFTFKVEGEGALEFFNSPVIISDSSVEEFDASSDLNVKEDFTSEKRFNYTYLPRSGGTIAAQELRFSYFDPDLLEYVEKTLKVPEIEIASLTGTGYSRPTVTPEARPQGDERVERPTPGGQTILGPLYTLHNTYKYNEKKIVLSLVIALILAAFFFNRDRIKELISKDKSLVSDIKKNGVDYSSLYKLVENLGSGKDMHDIVMGSNLSDQAKGELTRLINECETSFKGSKKVERIKMKNSVLREVSQSISKSKA